MRSYREKFAEWDALSANLKPLLAEMPYLEDEHQQFEAAVTEGRALSQRQQREAAALRETIASGRRSNSRRTGWVPLWSRSCVASSALTPGGWPTWGSSRARRAARRGVPAPDSPSVA